MKQLRPASVHRGGAESRRKLSYIWSHTDSRPALSGTRQVRPARGRLSVRGVYFLRLSLRNQSHPVGVGDMRPTSLHPRGGVRRAVGG